MSCHCPLNNLELDVTNASSPRRAGELVVLPLALESDAALGVALPSYSKTKLFTFSTATYPKLGCCALPPAAAACPRSETETEWECVPVGGLLERPRQAQVEVHRRREVRLKVLLGWGARLDRHCCTSSPESPCAQGGPSCAPTMEAFWSAECPERY